LLTGTGRAPKFERDRSARRLPCVEHGIASKPQRRCMMMLTSPAPEPEPEKYPITLWRVLGWAAKICLMPLMLIIEWRQRRLLRALRAAEAAGADSFTFGRTDYLFYSGCKPQDRVKPPR
jgi:hypothetical protein